MRGEWLPLEHFNHRSAPLSAINSDCESGGAVTHLPAGEHSRRGQVQDEIHVAKNIYIYRLTFCSLARIAVKTTIIIALLPPTPLHTTPPMHLCKTAAGSKAPPPRSPSDIYLRVLAYELNT